MIRTPRAHHERSARALFCACSLALACSSDTLRFEQSYAPGEGPSATASPGGMLRIELRSMQRRSETVRVQFTLSDPRAGRELTPNPELRTAIFHNCNLWFEALVYPAVATRRPPLAGEESSPLQLQFVLGRTLSTPAQLRCEDLPVGDQLVSLSLALPSRFAEPSP